MTLREALLESNNAAAVLLQQRVGIATGAPAGQGPRRHRTARRPVAGARQRARHAARSDRRLRRVSQRSATACGRAGSSSVENACGSTVHRVAHRARARSCREQVSFQMVTMLQDVVARGTGAAVAAQGIRGPVGGKTGTTSENRDAWFVGFNSSVVVGVWVGFDQPQKIFEGASGSRVALPIWADFMRRTARRLPAAAFEAARSASPREHLPAVVSPRARRLSDLRRVFQRGR